MSSSSECVEVKSDSVWSLLSVLKTKREFQYAYKQRVIYELQGDRSGGRTFGRRGFPGRTVRFEHRSWFKDRFMDHSNP